MTYQSQRKSNADLLAWVQAKVDASASAVDGSTGIVTTTSTWTEGKKFDWNNYWHSGESFEIV